MIGWLARLLRRPAPTSPAAGPGEGRSEGPAPPGPPPDDAGQLGRLSEQTARAFLERAGFRILAANYRCPLGELDLVAEGEGRLVFVEVKARRLSSPLPPPDGPKVMPGSPLPLGERSGVRATGADGGAAAPGPASRPEPPVAPRAVQPAPRPESAVDRRKQKRIGRAAKYFCRARRRTDAVVRFDVIAIDWPDAGDPVIRHHKSAFRPDV